MSSNEIKTADLSSMGWEQRTAEGSELVQLRVWSVHSKRLEALDEMCEHAGAPLRFGERGDSLIFDLYTGQFVQEHNAIGLHS